MSMGTPVEDANNWGAEVIRREKFTTWLLDAWDWAGDHKLIAVSDLAELLTHTGEMDYPIWAEAKERGLIGLGRVANMLSQACGLPPDGPLPTGFEKELFYSPVISLPEPIWREIHGALGWVNRRNDPSIPDCFWLWSDAANMVRFKIRKMDMGLVESIDAENEDD